MTTHLFDLINTHLYLLNFYKFQNNSLEIKSTFIELKSNAVV